MLIYALQFQYKLSNDNTHIKIITVPFFDGEKKQKIDARIAMWISRNAFKCLRISLGIIYFWFGVLKFFPGLSPAETLAAKTISHLSVGYIPSFISLPLLAVWECTIGIGFMVSRSMRVVLFLFFCRYREHFYLLYFFRMKHGQIFLFHIGRSVYYKEHSADFFRFSCRSHNMEIRHKK